MTQFRPVDSRRVAVLLATHNCERWLPEQLRSIFGQQNVRVSVVASDDTSTDSTLEILREYARHEDLRVLPTAAARFGNANRNFLRLIAEAPLGDADYIALADHDDIWFGDKLSVAIERLLRDDLDAYSSDVVALWPDGALSPIVKSRPQRRYDHLFESPGPGNTFVFARRRFDELRQWVRSDIEVLGSVKVHDWLIYAYARTRGWRWLIHDRPSLLYRQHARNELGANAGLGPAMKRLRQVRDGFYREDILVIARTVGDQSPVVRWLTRFNMLDRICLAINARQCRRRRSEAIILALMFLLMPRRQRRRELEGIEYINTQVAKHNADQAFDLHPGE
jgi:rhamnosyltransferase